MKCCINCGRMILLLALMIVSINAKFINRGDKLCDCKETSCACNSLLRLAKFFLPPRSPKVPLHSGRTDYLNSWQSHAPAIMQSPHERLCINCLFQGFRRFSLQNIPQHHHRSHPVPTLGVPVRAVSPVLPFPPAAIAPSGSSKVPVPSHLSPVPSPAQEPSPSPGAQVVAPDSSHGSGLPGSPPMIALPLSPTNTGCQEICSDTYTSSPPGSPCGCVIPIRVGLELEITLYALFRLVSELSDEVAAGTYLSQSQVRIVGANANSEDLDKTQVTADLVPLNEAFDMTTVVLTAQRFWSHQVSINETLFGNYSVLFIHYPGLPSSPPSSNSSGKNESMGIPSNQPLSVNVRNSPKLGSGAIAAIALSSAVAVLSCLALIWCLFIKCCYCRNSAISTEVARASLKTKNSGGGSILTSTGASSPTMSFTSSFGIYTGSAKTYALTDLETATNRFSLQNKIGEGGFGRVYRGTLDDGTQVAVKVLTRDDKQGGREFTAEVEMLSRLHHRNLVKLMGICTEEHTHCLVYELIPNGSVESHLHGADKEVLPLDWEARVKIALGAARGLAYLHEDSNPRVIHRDFKASNILLEDDFTPKVSDFGLAKAASDQMSGHISTRVMGTFGYVAPEYAMTGHLLVKSDVYSYGVVLLELLSGRKPVDMSQPPGQENLVSWARTLLNTKEGLTLLVDPTLRDKVPFDCLAKVAAIASMCVQPEVSHRPFMGEVVQALKLVYNDSDASDGPASENASVEAFSLWRSGDLSVLRDTPDAKLQCVSDNTSFVSIDYDSGPCSTFDFGNRFSASAVLSKSCSFLTRYSGSFRRQNASGPLQLIRSKNPTRGAVSEQSTPLPSDPGVSKKHSDHWL